MLRKSDSDERDLLMAVWRADAEGWWRWRRRYDLETCPARFHSLFPLLSRRLPGEVLGLADARILRGVYRYHWTRNQLFKKRLSEALQALNDSSIESLVLDDLALALAGYQDLGTRPLLHTSLLVRPQARDLAVRVLERIGWEPELRPGVVSCHLVDRHHPKRSLSLLSSASDGWWRGEEDWWQAAQRATECPGLAPEHALQRLLLRAYEGTAPLLWVSDGCALLQQNPDFHWSRFFDSCQRRRIALLVSTALTEVGEWVELPDQVHAWVATCRPDWGERLYTLARRERFPAWSRFVQDYLNFLTWTQPGEAARLRSMEQFLRHRWELDRFSPRPRLHSLWRRLRSRLGRIWRGVCTG